MHAILLQRDKKSITHGEWKNVEKTEAGNKAIKRSQKSANDENHIYLKTKPKPRNNHHRLKRTCKTKRQQKEQGNTKTTRTKQKIIENRKRKEQLAVDQGLKTSYALENKRKNFPDQPKPCNQPCHFPFMALRSVVWREQVLGTTALPLSRCLKGVAIGACQVASGDLVGASGATSSEAASSRAQVRIPHKGLHKCAGERLGKSGTGVSWHKSVFPGPSHTAAHNAKNPLYYAQIHIGGPLRG